MEPNKSFCSDEFWNSELAWAEENPELTLCFKQTVLVWVPCGFLFLFSLLDYKRRENSRSRDIPWTILNGAKFLITFLLICSTINVLLATLDVGHEIHFTASHFVAIAVKLVAFTLVAVLQYFHKLEGHRSSGLLFTFWLLMTFCSIPIMIFDVADSNHKNFDGKVPFVIYFLFIVAMLILNCFSDKPAKYTTYPISSNPSPEVSASIFNRMLFIFFDLTAWTGWKRPLTEQDIFNANPEDTSREVYRQFHKNFVSHSGNLKSEYHVSSQKLNIGENASEEKNKRKHSDAPADKTSTPQNSILLAMMKTFGATFLLSNIFKFVVEMLQFASPLLLGALISYIRSNGSLWKGLFLSFSLFIVSFLISVLREQYALTSFQVGIRSRSAVTSAIFRKALRISSAARRNTSVGEIVNLIAVDVQKLLGMVPCLPILWTGPIVALLAIVLLWHYIGVAVFAGVAVLVAMVPVSSFIAVRLKNFQIGQMKVKDERVKSTNEILNGIKVIKLYAWEPTFENLITSIRERELVFLKNFAMYNASTEIIFSLAPFLVGLFSYMTFVFLGNTLTPEIAFVSMALFNILKIPMTQFSMMLNAVLTAYVSVKRLDKFLNANELDPMNVTNEPSENALEIKDGIFSWSDEETTLKNINLSVKKGSLTAVVGNVACGKSSLISAMLGEMEKIQGRVNVDGRVAYVSQQAWIQNATLRDNITFAKSYDEQFYKRVIKACALGEDLSMLPDGDQTEIGEKGINLSGGQKQRVALARAIYNDADIYIFDDPLSAVDAHVGKHIFDSVMSRNGMLKDKTRFLVTHGISFLPKVDEILVMVNGEISESGSYEDILAQKGDFSDFISQYQHENESNSSKCDELKISRESDLEKSDETPETTKESQESTEMLQKLKAKLVESEDAAIGSVHIGVYLRYFKSVGMPIALAILFLNTLNQSMSVLSNFWLTQWSTDERASEDDKFCRNFYVGIYAVLGSVQGFALFINAIVFALGALRAARNLHNGLLFTILRLPMSFFDTTPLGRIINRFTKDIDVIDSLLPLNMRNWIWMTFSVASVFIVISISTPIFILVAVPVLVLYYFIQKFYVVTLRQLQRMESITKSPIISHFSEAIGGQSTIRAFKEERRFTFDCEAKVDHNQAISYMGIVANRWIGVRLEIVGNFVVLAAALFAVTSRATIDEAIVGLSITYALQLSNFTSFLVRNMTEVETNIVAVERVEEYSDRPKEAPWKTVEMDPEWPQQGVIEFQNLQVRYRDETELVLRGISFSVKSQEKVGIVGRTGAGKTSLTLALFRIVEAAGGKIIIDDIDVAKIGLHSLRSRLTIIPQDPVLFSGSLRMNIDPFDFYPDDAVWRALEHSHLKAYVADLPDGLHYKITEGGENLSVGQRQLVCLARALLRKSKILILDEATAALDIETDELIQKTIREYFSDCTIITIAHRLNTITDADRIIVLDQGIIAENDSPQSLLANTNSIFYGMIKAAGLI